MLLQRPQRYLWDAIQQQRTLDLQTSLPVSKALSAVQENLRYNERSSRARPFLTVGQIPRVPYQLFLLNLNQVSSFILDC